MIAALRAFLLLALWAGPALAGVNGLERVPVAGADYVRLGEWAEKNGLTMVWRKKDDPIVVTNPAASLRFAVESTKAQINGVNVSLGLPVIHRGGVPWISLIDVEKTLQPILFPRKSRARVQTIFVDAGHGGSDPGASSGTHLEKTYTLLLAQAVENLLQDRGFKVAMTRNGDDTVRVEERPGLAARADADLFVSLHYNRDAGAMRGVEVHYMAPAGMKSSNGGWGRGTEDAVPGNACDDRNVLLAYQVLKSITTALPVEDISVKHSHLFVLKEARMPAILIEGGYMSDPQDARQIYDAQFRQRMAQSIVNGIVAYKKAVEETGPVASSESLQVKSPGRPSPARGRD
jgi:N-acetylmuramoyl-L-alanine amidase